MPTYLDYYIPSPGRGITKVATMGDDLDIKVYEETDIDESLNELLDQELIVTYERPYYPYRNAIPGLTHLLEQYYVKSRWLDIFTEIRKATGKQIALSKVIKSTFGDTLQLKITRLGNSLGDPEYRPNLETKIEDRLNAVKELYQYILEHDQVSYEQGGTTYWADMIINEMPFMED